MSHDQEEAPNNGSKPLQESMPDDAGPSATHDAGVGGAATATSARPFSRKRFLLKLGVTLSIMGVVIAGGWALTELPQQAERERIAEQSTELLEKLFRADPEMLASVKGVDASGDAISKYFLTPETAAVALGDHVTATTRSENVSVTSGSATATSTVHTRQGDFPVSVSFRSNGDKTSPRSWTPEPIYLPTLEPTTGYQAVPGLKITLKLYGSALALKEPPRSLSGNKYLVWPGTTELGVSSNAPYVMKPASASFTFPFDVNDERGRTSGTAESYHSAALSDSFTALAKASVASYVKSCNGADSKIPRDCPFYRAIGPYDNGGPRDTGMLRSVTRKVLGAPDGSRIELIENSPGSYRYTLDSGTVLTSGQWLDGSTWRSFETATTFYVRGTLREADGAVKFTPDPDNTLGAYEEQNAKDKEKVSE